MENIEIDYAECECTGKFCFIITTETEYHIYKYKSPFVFNTQEDAYYAALEECPIK